MSHEDDDGFRAEYDDGRPKWGVDVVDVTYDTVADQLTERQRRFVEAYKTCGVASQAAAEAGYSPRYANRQGARLLRHPVIQAAIREHAADRAEEVEALRWRISAELGRIAFADPEEIAEWPSGRLSDKRGALDTLANIHGLKLDRLEVSGGEGAIVFLPRNGSEADEVGDEDDDDDEGED